MFNHLKYIPGLSYRGRRPSIMEREAMRRRPLDEAEKRERQATCDKYIAEYTAKAKEWRERPVAEIRRWYEQTLYYHWDFPLPMPLSDADAEKVRADRIRNCERSIREWQMRRPA